MRTRDWVMMFGAWVIGAVGGIAFVLWFLGLIG